HASFDECTRCFGRCAFPTRIRPARLGGAQAAVAADSVAAQAQGRGRFFAVKRCRAAHRRKALSALPSALSLPTAQCHKPPPPHLAYAAWSPHPKGTNPLWPNRPPSRTPTPTRR